MGKKMGMNSKAVAAKERKHGKAAKDAALEDAKWKDDGNPLAKKQVGGLIICNVDNSKSLLIKI